MTITIEEKKGKILAAVAKGVNKRKLDPPGKGRAIKKLEDGKTGVSVEKINEIYERLIGHEQTKQACKQTPIPPKKANKSIDHIAEITEKLATQEGLIQAQQNHIENMQKEINKLKQTCKQTGMADIAEQKPEPKQSVFGFSIVEQKPKQTLFGFSIKETTTKSKGISYRVYKAFRCINGKSMSVYIGRNKSQAKEKIISYLCKNHEKLADTVGKILEEYPGLFSIEL